MPQSRPIAIIPPRAAPEPVPYEDIAPLIAAHLATFKELRFFELSPQERRRWIRSGNAAIGNLRVMSCGVFVGSHGHYRERRNLPEGILIYCTAGRGFCRIGGKEHPVGAGDLLYCPPESAHAYGAGEKDPWTIVWAHLSGRQLPQLETLLGLVEDGPVRRIGMHAPLIDAFLDLTGLFRPPYDSRRFLTISAMATRIMGLLADLPVSAPGRDATRVEAVKARMEEVMDKPFELSRFAESAECSVPHLARIFKRHTGMSPAAYFNRRKIQQACGLLCQPGARVSEVAAKLGYANAFYFSERFKKTMGISPSAYRKQATGGGERDGGDPT